MKKSLLIFLLLAGCAESVSDVEKVPNRRAIGKFPVTSVTLFTKSDRVADLINLSNKNTGHLEVAVSPAIRACQFRVDIEQEILMFYDAKGDLNGTPSYQFFHRCSILRNGDLIEVRRVDYAGGKHGYEWRAGDGWTYLQ